MPHYRRRFSFGQMFFQWFFSFFSYYRLLFPFSIYLIFVIFFSNHNRWFHGCMCNGRQVFLFSFVIDVISRIFRFGFYILFSFDEKKKNLKCHRKVLSWWTRINAIYTNTYTRFFSLFTLNDFYTHQYPKYVETSKCCVVFFFKLSYMYSFVVCVVAHQNRNALNHLH